MVIRPSWIVTCVTEVVNVIKEKWPLNSYKTEVVKHAIKVVIQTQRLVICIIEVITMVSGKKGFF